MIFDIFYQSFRICRHLDWYSWRHNYDPYSLPLHWPGPCQPLNVKTILDRVAQWFCWCNLVFFFVFPLQRIELSMPHPLFTVPPIHTITLSWASEWWWSWSNAIPHSMIYHKLMVMLSHEQFRWAWKISVSLSHSSILYLVTWTVIVIHTFSLWRV